MSKRTLGPGHRPTEYARDAVPNMTIQERDGIMIRVFRSGGVEVVDESSFRPLPKGRRSAGYQPNRMCEPAVTDRAVPDGYHRDDLFDTFRKIARAFRDGWGVRKRLGQTEGQHGHRPGRRAA